MKKNIKIITLISVSLLIFSGYYILSKIAKQNWDRNLTGYYKIQSGKVVYKYYNFTSEENETRILDAIDPITFRTSKEDPQIAYDANSVYCGGKKINYAEPKTFKSIKNGPYYIDQKHAYYIPKQFSTCHIRELTIAKPATFVSLGDNYAKDADRVYFKEKEISNANAETFVVIHDQCGYGKDLNNIYYETIKIENVDIKTFVRYANQESTECTFVDKNRVYQFGKEII
jgi:hypothetical protein